MFTTQVSTPKAITYSTSENTSVNKFDATVDIPSINLSSYIQLPSVKQDAAKLKPNAVNEKEQEIAAIVNAAKMLESEYASYVDEFVTRGNQALYAVLAKIYAVALQINLSDNEESIIKSLRNVMSLQKKIKTQKNSSALTLLVRWVVGGSRQLAHTYSKALEAAYKDNIAADELAAYFTKQGGLNGASKRNSEQKEVVSTVRETEFNQFMRTADICSKSFENTKIKWTEEVFMNNTSGHAMILGHNSGGGNIHGYRAFNLSNEAFKKISKILADELFKAKREDEIAAWVKQDSDNAYAKKSELAQGAVSA